MAKKTADLQEIGGGTSFFSADTNVLFKFSSAASKLSGSLLTKDEKNTDTTEVPLHDSDFSNNSDIAYYGADNAYPDIINEIIQGNNSLSGGIPKRVSSIFAKGIKTAEWVDDKTLTPIRYKPFQDFVRNHSDFIGILYQMIADLLVYRWSPVEFLFSADGSKILGLGEQKVIQNRFGYNKQKKLLDGTIWLNSDWRKNGTLNKQNSIQRKLINYTHFAVENLKEDGPDMSMFKVLMFPHNEKVYPKSAIHAAIEQGWVDISNDEAKYIKALIKNRTTIVTVVEIKDWYWPLKFGNDEWQKLSADERKAKKKLEVSEFNRMVAGVEQSGKTLMVDVKTQFLQNQTKSGQIVGNPALDKSMAAWEIKTVDMAKMDETMTKYGDVARKEVFWSIGLDWLTAGSTTQENQAGGSGKQQSRNIELILDEYLRQMILQVIYFVRDYNGWSKDIEFDFDLPVMQTLATMSPSERQLKPTSTGNA
jgi:hypothetical protein